jgi:hemolysin activation/secretion protein
VGLVLLNSLKAHSDEPVFAISGYEISGNTLLPEPLVQEAVGPFTGEQKNFQTIQEALKALENKYAEAGYGAVRVMLPEQEIDNGRIKLKVVEARIGEIKVEGNTHFSTDNIRASVPALREGDMPQMNTIAASLRVANENIAKQTSLVFRPSAKDNQIDATLRVIDEAPLKLGVSLDNTGTESTGKYRLGLLLQHANLFDSDHIASAQIITSPGHESDVKVFGLGYKIPIYHLGDSIDLAYGYSNVNSGALTVGGSTLGISGSGHIASAKYNIYLPAVQDWQHKVSIGMDYRAYTNEVVDNQSGQNLVPDITVRPMSLTYSWGINSQSAELSGYLTYAKNIPGASNGSREDFEASRTDASSHYSVTRYGLNLGYALPADWMLRASFAGQYTRDLLVSGEQFGIGGNDTVRGFLEREVANDKGTRGSLEIYTPDFSSAFGVEKSRVQALVFYDLGQVVRNKPLPGEDAHENIASAGVGLRLNYARSLNLKLDYGIVTQAGGEQKTGDSRLHGSVLWFF